MVKYVIVYLVVMTSLSIAYNIDFGNKDKAFDRRKRQANLMQKKALLEEKIEDSIIQRVDVNKRRKVVSELRQAGIDVSYSEYVLFRIFTTIIFGILVGFFMSNIALAIVFAIVGFFIPHQIVMVIRNKRVATMEKQIGSFMNMLIKRYEMSKDMSQALKNTAKEFEGEEPLYSEINKTILEIDLGTPVVEGLENFAERIDNKYMRRFATYYENASSIGTESLRKNLLNQALLQYEESNSIKQELQKEISGPVQEAYIMICSVPVFAIWQSMSNEDYLYFYKHVTMGKISAAIMVGTLLLVTWFVHNKLGATIE